MTKEQKQLFLSKRGQIVDLIYKKKLKTLKNTASNIEKVVERTARVGINYSNLGAIQEARKADPQDKEHPLPWGQWKIFPNVIEHNGKTYLRFYKAPNEYKKVLYLMDGKPVDKDQIEGLVYSDELDDNNDKLIFNVAEDHVIDIH